MTIQKAWPFQEFIVGLISAAVPAVPVYSYQPHEAPDRFIRVDGSTTTPTDAAKNSEQARHGVTIHAIDSPNQGTNSQKWVKESIGAITAALTDVRLDAASGGLRPEMSESRLEPRSDNLNDAHALVRFTALVR